MVLTSAIQVRLTAGAPQAAAVASLNRIVDTANRAFASTAGGSAGNSVVLKGMQRPAEIVNYKTIALMPTLLVSGLALGAIAARALTLPARCASGGESSPC
ncbi:MAG TPA: hypothetical protein VG244_03185 [Acidimicrobiales bacterium]|nr:hypothetical protein [Acidimicrobiales bacterium]